MVPSNLWPIIVSLSGLRDFGWKQRLWIEECLAGFGPTLLQEQVMSSLQHLWQLFSPATTYPLLNVWSSAILCRLHCSQRPGAAISSVSLPFRSGPKLLVSDWGTFDKPILRWRLRIWGNMAVEFEVVPLSMVVKTQSSCLPMLQWMQSFFHKSSHSLSKIDKE